MMMANPRRSSYNCSNSAENSQTPYLASINQFLKKPHAFPFLLSIFLFITWVSLRLQHSSHFTSPQPDTTLRSREDDSEANLIRFNSGFPSKITKDKRGWLLDPITLALDSGITGGAVTCASVHMGEIRAGSLRGNHRHYDCNETFVIWGAKTKFRLENSKVFDSGYAEVMIDADEIAVAASPSGTAHALINVDPVRSTFFMGCQDSIISYNSSSTDFNVWKDL